MSTELLNLDTLVERDTIRIKSTRHPAGKSYEVRNENELSLWDASALRAYSQQLQDLDPETKPTPAAARRHRAALKSITELIVDKLEPDVLDRLSDVQMLAVFGVFNRSTADEDGGPGEAESGPTSAASSRASSGSTAATHRRGSARRSGS